MPIFRHAFPSFRKEDLPFLGFTFPYEIEKNCLFIFWKVKSFKRGPSPVAFGKSLMLFSLCSAGIGFVLK
jgi:hypothetical protein